MCGMWWPLTLTYIFKVIWPWLHNKIGFTWDPIWLSSMGNHEAAGVSSEHRRSSCSNSICYIRFILMCPVFTGDDVPWSRFLSSVAIVIPPPYSEVVGGVCILVTLRPSVRTATRVGSVVPTVLVGSFSYLYILSSNFRRCVTCKVSCKISKYEFLAIF